MKRNINFQLNKGFTLIELLVVVAIISLLSSVIFSSLKNVRAKARDTQRIIEFNQVKKALDLYFDKFGGYPTNNIGGDGTYALNFSNMAQTLVNEGFLSKVPVSPCGLNCAQLSGGYAFFNYGASASVAQVLLVTNLETFGPSTTGISPSCRFDWGVGTNWCDDSVSTYYYCICLFYNK